MKTRFASVLIVAGLAAALFPAPALAVASMYPTSGPATGGTLVTISGGAGYTVGTTVTICGKTVAATTILTGGTGLTFLTPACSTDGLSAVDTNGPSTIGLPGFNYTAVTPGSVTLSPASGQQGTIVTLSAPGQGPFTSSTTVTIGGVAATAVFATSTTALQFQVPNVGAAGVVVISTANPATVGIPTFSYLLGPALGMYPTTGVTNGGTTVTLTGPTGGFDYACVVNGFASTIYPTGIASYGNSMTFVTVAGTGTVTVTVGAVAGAPAGSCQARGGSAGTFTFSGTGGGGGGTPYLSPTGGPAGTAISIYNGIGFTTATTITLCGTATLPTTVLSGGTGLTFVAPTCAPLGAQTVSTTNPTYANVGTFTYAAGTVTPPVVYPPSSPVISYTYPFVTSVSPNSGSRAGANTVTITGGNFLAGATVMFGAAPATGVTILSSTSLSAMVPAGVGTVSVIVTNPDGTSGQLPNGYTYNATGYICGAATALDITTTGPFSTSTKVADLNQYVTYAFGCGTPAAGQVLVIYRAVKSSSGTWGSFTPYTSRVANSGGTVYYNVRSSSSAWWSFYVQIAGVQSPARQARWTP